MNLVRNS